MRKALFSASFGLLLTTLLGGCGSELTADQPGLREDGTLDTANSEFHAASAKVGEQAEVTATSLNLRTGPGTTYAVLTSMPKGTIVKVEACLLYTSRCV